MQRSTDADDHRCGTASMHTNEQNMMLEMKLCVACTRLREVRVCFGCRNMKKREIKLFEVTCLILSIIGT